MTSDSPWLTLNELTGEWSYISSLRRTTVWHCKFGELAKRNGKWIDKLGQLKLHFKHYLKKKKKPVHTSCFCCAKIKKQDRGTTSIQKCAGVKPNNSARGNTEIFISRNVWITAVLKSCSTADLVQLNCTADPHTKLWYFDSDVVLLPCHQGFKVQDQFSPYNYPYTVKRYVLRINKMITQEKILWSLNKFSQLIL